ncbi:MAG TPA: hypothetical protein VEU51_10110 [Candidatus Acidoferrales bacterium]|nr:hypothetical protein [Candidatus Acidoferrales bacterium]
MATKLAQDAVPEIRLPIASRPGSSVFASQPPSLKSVFPAAAVKTSDPEVTVMGAPGLVEIGAPRRAVVTQFDYVTGLLVTVTVDLAAKKVLAVKVARDRPAPLSAAELSHALDLAIANNSDLKRLATQFGRDKLGVEIMMPVDSRKTSPRYGHRLVLLWVETPQPSDRAMVDLTTDQVSSGD